MKAATRFWLLTAAAVLGCALTAALGRWQLHRAADKEALQAQIDARAHEALVDARSLAQPDEAAALLYRRAEARGHWIAERTIYLDNRPMHGRAGFYVVTPLRLEGSDVVVLVERGWAPRDFEDRNRMPAVTTSAGPVAVQGRIAPTLSRIYQLGEPGRGAIRQNLDVARFRAETGLPLATLVLQQTGTADDGLLRDWPPITTGVDKHYGYAFQWFGLSALIAALYVWFQIVRRFKQRAR